MFTRQFYKDMTAIVLCLLTVIAVTLAITRFDQDPSINRPTGPESHERVQDIVYNHAMREAKRGFAAGVTSVPAVTDSGLIPPAYQQRVYCDTFQTDDTLMCVDGATGEVVATYPVDPNPTVTYEQGCEEDEVLAATEFGYSEHVTAPDGNIHGVGESVTVYECQHNGG